MTTNTIVIPAIMVAINLFLSYFVLPPYIHYPRRMIPPTACAESYFSITAENRSEQWTQSIHFSMLRESARTRWIHLIGDSTLRETFYEYLNLMKRLPVGQPVSKSELAKRYEIRHANRIEVKIGSTTISYSYRPYLADALAEYHNVCTPIYEDRLQIRPPQSTPALIVFSVGLHDLLYGKFNITDTLLILMKNFSIGLLAGSSFFPCILFQSSPAILEHSLKKEHHLAATHFRNSELIKLNSKIKEALHAIGNVAFVDIVNWTATRALELDDDGLHSAWNAQQLAMSLASFTVCSLGMPQRRITSGQMSIFWISAMLIILYVFTAFLRLFRVILKINYSTLQTEESVTKINSDPENIYEETSTLNNRNILERTTSLPWYNLEIYGLSHDLSELLFAVLQICVVLLFAYTMDSNSRLSWQLIGNKIYVRDTFLFICLIILVLAFMTSKCTDKKPNSNGTILNRDQTEEWKGFMQILFVLYHYFAAKEFYNLIRLLIAAYLWLTGYGHFSFFYQKKDYSFVRLFKMLFRLNFFVLVICITMDREFMQYYICALHTFFFLFVYVVMRIGSWYNSHWSFLTIKMILSFCFLWVLFDIPQLGLFKLIFGSFKLFYLKNSLHEWLFRSTLDHYATWFGMLCAWNPPMLEFLYNKLDTSSYKKISLCTLYTTLACILFLWFRYCLLLPKSIYNSYNPYTTWIPILIYIIGRNSTTSLRKHSMDLFTWCGKITLETYILQFHIWLSDDAATIIQYFPEYPLLNFAFASFIYVTLSYITFHATNTISEFLIPKGCTTRQLSLSILWILGGYNTLKNLNHVVLIMYYSS